MSRIETLMAAMTCEEKIGQLTMATAGYAVTGPVLASDATEGIRAGRIGSMLNLWGAAPAHAIQRMAVEESRLGVPLLLGFDVLHGHRTIFPIPLAEAAAFDPALWERTARVAAIEAARDGISMTFAPMVDVARDPRWGRIAEGPGEDPWVAARFAEAKVRGFQGSDLSAADSVVATVKHFCAYGAAVAGRDYASADVSERSLHEIYLPPFQAAIAAGCAAIMPAFNDVAGVPMTAHVALLRDWLRGKAGFDGVIVSDYNAISELMRHGVAGDLVEAAALALKAGVDIDMMSGAYGQGLPIALDHGLIDIHDIDAAAFRVLTLKERLGLFDNPYRRGAAGPPDASDETARRQLAREAARRSIVALTNDGVLPLAEKAKRIAVVGPLADARIDMRGSWAAAGDVNAPVTILDGLKAALPDRDIVFAQGVAIEAEDVAGIAGALDACRSADVVVLCLGESARMSGEAASRGNPGLPGRQRALAEAVLDLRKPVVALLSSGRPLIAPWLFTRANSVVATWFLGNEAGHAIADIVTGRFNPTGRLPVTWPYDIGQAPIFFGALPTGRPPNPKDHFTSKYLDMPVAPQFPFGHGLSYSRFALKNLRVDIERFGPADTVAVSVDVVNEGPQAGEATVFVFIHDVVASISRPMLELKGVAKITLAPGESGAVRLSLPASAFAFPGRDYQPVLESGRIELLAGLSAEPAGLLKTNLQAMAD